MTEIIVKEQIALRGLSVFLFWMNNRFKIEVKY